MEEVIEHACGESSSHELAIHFLLRHAACRMALTIETDDPPPAEATRHQQPLDGNNKLHDRTADAGLVDSPSQQNTPVTEVVAEHGFTARFSRAYAVARHIQLISRSRC
ncbi:MAG: hypothetical protein ABI268_02370 [Rhodanobacter sp.]